MSLDSLALSKIFTSIYILFFGFTIFCHFLPIRKLIQWFSTNNIRLKHRFCHLCIAVKQKNIMLYKSRKRKKLALIFLPSF